MSEQKHTPGPWKARKSSGLNAFELRAGEAYLADVWGADTPVPNGVKRGAAKANAHLIAAAPEMMEALIQVAAAWSLEDCTHDSESDICDACRFEMEQRMGLAMTAARAAIAKAGGRQS